MSRSAYMHLEATDTNVNIHKGKANITLLVEYILLKCARSQALDVWTDFFLILSVL